MSTRAEKTPSWLKELVGSYRGDIACALALGFIASACAALLMFTSGYLISATAMAQTTLFSILVPVACVQLFGFGRPLARYLERLASHSWVLRITSDLRLRLYRSIAAKANDPASSRSTGEYLSVLSDDVAHLQNLYLRVVFPTAIAYLLAAGCALLFGFFSLPAALVVLVALAGVTVVLPSLCLRLDKAASRKAKVLKEAGYARLADDAYGAIDWILAHRTDSESEHLRHADRDVRTLEAASRRRRRAFSLVSTLVLGAMLVGVVLWAGSAFGQTGGSPNWIAAFALGFFPLIESFAVMPAAFSESTAHHDAIARLDGIMEQDEGESDHPRHISAIEPSQQSGAAIEIEGLSYTYPGAVKSALHGVCLAIPIGQTVAVIGKSGSGKSTLSDIMCGRLLPDEGSMSLFGTPFERSFAAPATPDTPTAPAAPTAPVTPAASVAPVTFATFAISETVGYLGQEPYLFNRTLRENLTLGIADASDERLMNVLDSVGLGHRVSTLPHGLDTVIGETGVGLSGGEGHRVALARILVADTPVVVLDEPFSSVDPATERALLDTLFDAFAGKTLVVITHHLTQIARFDRVIWVKEGRIDLDGSPEELMRTSDRFNALMALNS